MRATSTPDAAIRELQDAARGKAGARAGDRWRTIQGTHDGAEALLVQRFLGGRTWETVQAFGLDGSPLVRPWFARATVDVTSGAPGTIAFVGTASGIIGVAIVALTTPVNPYRVARFTFRAAMPDTDYVVSAIYEWTAGVNGVAIGADRTFLVVTKATTHFDVGIVSGVPDYRQIDEYARRLSVVVNR